MSESSSDYNEESDSSYKDHSVSNRYSFNYDLVKIVDLTVHTVRQSWVLLKESLPYDLNPYLKDGSLYPDFNVMKKYLKFSSLAYISIYSVGTVICEVSKPDPIPSTTKHSHSGKSSKSKLKPDPFAVVIVAISVLPNHSGIGLSKRLLKYTINKIKEAKLTKVYALADLNNEFTVNFYRNNGFLNSTCTFTDVVSNLKVQLSRDLTQPSYVIMEMSISS